MFFSTDLNVVERQTYSVLDWLGDLGGLFDALRYSVGLIIAPIAAYALKAELLSSVFRFTASMDPAQAEKEQRTAKKDKEHWKKHMEWDFRHLERI